MYTVYLKSCTNYTRVRLLEMALDVNFDTVIEKCDFWMNRFEVK